MDGYERLFKAHYHKLIRFVMCMGASLRDAEEAASDAFYEGLVLAKGKPNEWNEIRSKEAWLRTVALRRCRRPSGLRRRPPLLVAELPDQLVRGTGHEDTVAGAQDVLRVLHTLPDEERTVAAFDLDDIPTADIAHSLEITEQRVRDVRKKYRAKLKRELGGNMNREGRQ